MNIKEYNFRGIKIQNINLETEIRTFIITPTDSKVCVEIDIKSETGEFIDRKNVNFKIKDEDIIKKLLDCLSDEFSFETLELINKKTKTEGD